MEEILGYWELCQSICEAMIYLSEHYYDQQVKSDIIDAIGILQPYKNKHVGLSRVFDEIKDLFSEERQNIDKNLLKEEIPNKLSILFGGIIYDELAKEINKVSYVPQPDAEKIFKFIDEAKSYNAAFVFEFCDKCAFSSPMQSYRHSLDVLRKNPTIIHGYFNFHPDYIYRDSEQKVFDKCPICGQKGNPFYRATSFKMSHFGYPHLPFKLWMKCEKCENLYTYEYPEELLNCCVLNDFVFLKSNNAYIAADRIIAGNLAIWSGILNKLSSYTKGKNILEVGIGNGELLAVALEMNYKVEAVEIVTSTAKKYSVILGIPIWNGDFLNYETDKSYDVIIMGDVIEHVTDPYKALLKAYNLLKSDGVLWLSTPNFESSFSRLIKFYDPMWCEPSHISYFSYTGLEKLIKNSGFEVKEYLVSNRYKGSMELILKKC